MHKARTTTSDVQNTRKKERWTPKQEMIREAESLSVYNSWEPHSDPFYLMNFLNNLANYWWGCFFHSRIHKWAYFLFNLITYETNMGCWYLVLTLIFLLANSPKINWTESQFFCLISRNMYITSYNSGEPFDRTKKKKKRNYGLEISFHNSSNCVVIICLFVGVAMDGTSHLFKDLCICFWFIFKASLLNKWWILGKLMSSFLLCWWVPMASPKVLWPFLTIQLSLCSNLQR